MTWLSVPNIPAKDQLSERTNDGRPPENADLDCVFASTAAAAQGLTGIFTSGDELKDLAKGEAYRGGGNEAWLVPLLARAPWHLRVGVRGGSQAQLIDILREEIKAGHPCVVTIPSHWSVAPANPLHPGNSHCVLACGIDTSDGGDMVAMNPWHGFWHRASIAWWRARLCDNAVWPISKIAVAPPPAAPVEPAYTWDAATKTLNANGAKLVLSALERI